MVGLLELLASRKLIQFPAQALVFLPVDEAQVELVLAGVLNLVVPVDEGGEDEVPTQEQTETGPVVPVIKQQHTAQHRTHKKRQPEPPNPTVFGGLPLLGG